MLIGLVKNYGRTLVLEPNHDPGRDGMIRAIEAAEGVTVRSHLPREIFIGLLRRSKALVGNSSAALIEGAGIPVRALNIGHRQRGRIRAANVGLCPEWDFRKIEEALQERLAKPLLPFKHPFGDGKAGPRTADILARFMPDKHPLQKRNTY